MNPYAILGVLLGFAGLGSLAVWERGDAEKWHRQYDDRVSQEQTAADKAKADAYKQEQADLANLAQQQTAAIGNAELGKQKAEAGQKQYQANYEALAKKYKDIEHLCAVTPLPADDLPKP